MRLLVSIDHHFVRTPDGEVYLGPPMSISGYSFWQRYMEVFDEVVVLARVRQVQERPVGALLAGGPRVIFHDLPDYLGPWQYARVARTLRRETAKAVEKCDAYVLRIPGAIGQLAWKVLRQRGLPFALEAVADPWDILSPGATKSVLRPWVRRRWSSQLRQACAEAAAICYVTREALQKRYPPGPQTWATYASDVELAEGIADEAQMERRTARLEKAFSTRQPFRVGFLGSLAQMYKAPDVLLRAAAICLKWGLNIEVAVAGDGKFRRSLQQLATELGIINRVNFLGALIPGKQVLQFLDAVDLFVLPSRQEGLPRALVEAMARGCPCIGSNVGGIPELLMEEDMVVPGDADLLATKISETTCDFQRLDRMSRRNWIKAQEYESGLLAERRREFYWAIPSRASNTSLQGSNVR